MDLFRLYAYEIIRCGYYRHGKRTPEFGGVADALSEVQLWVKNKTLGMTNLYKPPENSDKLEAYCFSIDQCRSNANLWLVVMWNRTHDEKHGIRIAKGSEKVGQISVSNQAVSPGDIPGFPAYFLIMAKEGLLFNILPEGQRHNGHQGICDFLEQFMSNVSSHAVLNDNPSGDSDKEIIGYKSDSQAQVMQLNAMFRTKLKRLPGRLDFLRKNFKKIRKIVRSGEISTGVAKEKSMLDKLMQSFGLERPTYGKSELNVRYQLDYRPTLEELDTIIEKAVDDDGDHAEVGFQLSTGNSIHWISQSIAKCELMLSVQPDGDQIYPASPLLEQLNARMHDLMKSTRH